MSNSIAQYNHRTKLTHPNSSAIANIRYNNCNDDDEEKIVPVLATGLKPLLGTSLLKGFRLEIDFEVDGVVSIYKI